jgi:hypothetical protein
VAEDTFTEVVALFRALVTVDTPAVRLAAVPEALVATRAEGVPRAGVTSVGEVDRTTAPVPVEVVTPVPPLATARVPVIVIVPEPVIGPPEVVRPVVPPETPTEVTLPPESLVYSKAVAPALTVRTCPAVPKALKLVPPLATGRTPVT